ncbi:hypothetical protein [Polaromonas sp. A23]|uniref:hypothetical protein n=1 Tax=Polaromonas sp. A23 TaxID=1944133 RepID=UPI000987C3B4|nr:hypothetical protein [Polaromonas sp. A23]OOG46636.1 hypothetical protein B0B52_03125 [Polaromonas sp. A23]
MKTPWASTLAWLLAAFTALALAMVAPNEKSVMGQFPTLTAQTLAQETLHVPGGFPAERTLALIAFRSTQRGHIDGWVTGLNLQGDSSIAWVRMPVLNDPGNTAARSAIETKLLHKYPAASERARLVPVFTDRERFIRAAGLNGPDQVYAVVINRDGEVLARAEGAFDADKASKLRETLLQQSF